MKNDNFSDLFCRTVLVLYIMTLSSLQLFFLVLGNKGDTHNHCKHWNTISSIEEEILICSYEFA